MLTKVEELTNKIGFSERTDAVIEPKLSLQWFMKMGELAKPALDSVMNDEIKFYPENAKNTYKHWMENIKDLCVSRQLWWGHRIPAYYYGEGPSDFTIANSAEKALEIAKEKSGNTSLTLKDLRQDEDVLDTWFSSWLWPISVFDGFKDPDNKDIQYYYPTNDLVTAPEIMFFWVSRIIMAGYEYKGEKPFKNVYYTGIVRDKQRRKMSKSLGNSPDPIELIEKHGADGVRVGMLFSSPAGNDLLFDESYCEQGRNFSNKIWNAFRLIKGWEVSETVEVDEVANMANDWFSDRFQVALNELNDNYDKFRMSDALMTSYKLTLDEFCSWYLEMVKPVYGEPIAKKNYDQVIHHLENVMRLLNPFMPFITEEIWQNISERKKGDSLMVNHWPKSVKSNGLVEDFELAKSLISEIRTVRKEKQISFKDKLELKVIANSPNKQFDGTITKLTNLESIEYVSEKVEGSISFVLAGNEYFIPLGGAIDVEAEKAKIQEEITYNEGFLKAVEKKLSNERFVSNAPEAVVAIERKKMADSQEKIDLLTKQMNSL